MTIRRRNILVVAVVLLGCFGGAVCVLSLRTSRELARLDAVAGSTFTAPSSASASSSIITAAVAYAHGMLNTPYDPLMGRYGDPFGKTGFVVCIDVPVRAYQAAGISVPALLRAATQEHPEWFSIGPDNSPKNSFFYRRVRNYYPLFRNHPALITDNKPQVGDWAFYGKFHIALVVKADPDGSFEVIEASPKKGRVAVSDGEYMARTWGPPVFFGRLRAATYKSLPAK